MQLALAQFLFDLLALRHFGSQPFVCLLEFRRPVGDTHCQFIMRCLQSDLRFFQGPFRSNPFGDVCRMAKHLNHFSWLVIP